MPRLFDASVRSRSAARRLLPVLPVLLLASGCAGDRPHPTVPPADVDAVAASMSAGPPIVVQDVAGLAAALSPENAGRRIVVRSGTYVLTHALVVPDGATLEGEGVMLRDDTGLPAGFAVGTRTTLTMAANVPGDVLTLRDGATVRRLAIDDLPGRAGNAIGIVSLSAGDRVSAAITDVEIVNPNVHGVAPLGPTGCGIAVLSQNPNMGGDPPPHAGAAISARVTRTLVRSPAIGVGCGIFAFNFAPSSTVSVSLAGNVIGGGIIASGGVSRPDAVHDSRTRIVSHRNLYRDDTPDACAARRLGWNLQGGAGTPVPLPNPGAARNSLRFHSVGDRIEGFTSAVLAAGARTFFPAPVAGPMIDNSVDLQLIGTRISTSVCGGVPSSDLRLSGAFVSNASLLPGDGNTLRLVMRGVTGSGVRQNAYADVLGPAGAQPAAMSGSGNGLTIVGSPRAFARTNRAVVPMPAPAFFTGGGQ